MIYLERYASGEHEQIWDDLLALGAKAREGQVYPDALAVARETMGRVRQNIEELIQRLLRIGFVFRYDHLLLTALSSPVITHFPKSGHDLWTLLIDRHMLSSRFPPADHCSLDDGV